MLTINTKAIVGRVRQVGRVGQVGQVGVRAKASECMELGMWGRLWDRWGRLWDGWDEWAYFSVFVVYHL